ncbi:MAG: flagellar basal body rod protein FlgC [Acidimicrobiia bacterium]
MSIFGILDTSGSGLHVNKLWLDAVSDNIANVNTVKRTSDSAFQERMVIAQEAPDASGSGVGSGVQVGGIQLGSADGQTFYDPQNPLADAQGNVKRPDIDLGDQMVQMMVAQRAYQANLAVIDRARDMYIQAMGIGK